MGLLFISPHLGERKIFITDPLALTPVEKLAGLWLKRDDLFQIAGVRGGKARACLLLARRAQGGLVTAGSRYSPQISIVAHLAKHFHLPCRIHTPRGPATPELDEASRYGAVRIAHRVGFNSVITARARQDSKELGWTEIPFGMECQEAVAAAAAQTANIPMEVRRLVVPVGSGITMAGILTGLARRRLFRPVLGVVVGADPCKRLDRWAPGNWRDLVELAYSELDYHEPVPAPQLQGIALDPYYEAKCLPYLAPGDCLWVVGRRGPAGKP